MQSDQPTADTPSTVDETIKRITHEYDALSKQQKIIALYVEKNREHIGIERITEVSQRCGVHPSAVVRFAKHFGFSGFRELQAMFRGDLSRQLMPSRNDTARIRGSIESGSHKLSNVEIAKEFLAGSIASMQEFAGSLDLSAFQNAVELLSNSDCIWIAASHRSFPIAAYLDYALQHTDKRIITINTMASMPIGQMHSVRAGDLMVVISFSPYSEETLTVARKATERGAKLIAISDSRMSPLAQLAHVALVVQENTTCGFRSLSCTMALAQSLFVALAYPLKFQESPPIPCQSKP